MRASRGVKMARNHTLRAQERNSENVQNRAWIDQKNAFSGRILGYTANRSEILGLKARVFQRDFAKEAQFLWHCWALSPISG